MDVQQSFLIKLQSLISNPSAKRFLLAVSGGIDSMVLSDLFCLSGLYVAIAHVNHQLRGNDSDRDAFFVRDFAEVNGVAYHELVLDWAKIPTGNKHANARAVRYEFFDNLAHTHNYDYIVTAHHLDDRLETMLMNAMRGSGLQGLTGLEEKYATIIRPLADISRKDIWQYAIERGISFRHDASNDSDVYMRNKVRHHLIPMMNALDERSVSGLAKTLKNLDAEQDLLRDYLASFKESCISNDGHFAKIDVMCLGSHKDTKLFYILRDFGFNFEQCSDILADTTSNGACIQSKSHEVLKSEHLLWLRSIDNSDWRNASATIGGLGKYNFGLKIVDVTKDDKDSLKDQNTLAFDPSKVNFPCVIRYKKDGDRFRPKSLKGKSKTVKAYLTDKKLNAWQKERSIVVEDCNGVIIGIFGFETAFDTAPKQEYIKLFFTVQHD